MIPITLDFTTIPSSTDLPIKITSRASPSPPDSKLSKVFGKVKFIQNFMNKLVLAYKNLSFAQFIHVNLYGISIWLIYLWYSYLIQKHSNQNQSLQTFGKNIPNEL